MSMIMSTRVHKQKNRSDTVHFETQKITEGTTVLEVPKVKSARPRGPASAKMPVFYNPAMEFSRDISVLALAAFISLTKESSKPHKPKKILDALAGTGARGVRYANEVHGDFIIHINDRNPLAYELIVKNIALNNIPPGRACALDKNLNVLLAENKYDYIDIDPFGSPVEFIDSAVRAVRRYGMLAITATDTAPLCGTYPAVCMRRYGAKSLRTPYAHELAVRILTGFCLREAVKYDLALEPVLAYSNDHYFRVYLRIDRGARRANTVLKRIGYAAHNFDTGERLIYRGERDYKYNVSAGYAVAGPLWTGKLIDLDFVRLMERAREVECSHLGTGRRIDKIIQLWKEEANAPPLYYDINELAARLKTSPMPLEKIISLLKEHGYRATRTHFCPTAVKTDATIGSILNILH